MAILLVYRIVLVWLCLAWAPMVLLAMLLWPLVDGEYGVSRRGAEARRGGGEYA